MRRLIAFPCEGETLIGTVDEAPAKAGLLIVSGGNEIRIGAHRGMAMLAQGIAQAGYPVLRFDRRGIGDSTGSNRGFRSSGPDIAAAIAAFLEAQPQIERMVAFGNCDAASALALFEGAPVDMLLLANPWIGEDAGDDTLPPAAAIRARYIEKLRSPREWLRMVRGGVNIGRVIKGLTKVSHSRSQPPPSLFAEIVAALAERGGNTRLLLASRDNTAVAFVDAWKQAPAALRERIACHSCDSASHSFAAEADKLWLRDQVLAALRD